MKQNIKKPYASVKWSLSHRLTGRQAKRKVKLLHNCIKKEYLTGSRFRPIPICSIAIYNLIINE